MKIFIRIQDWTEFENKVSIKYFIWDGVCLCTKEFKQSIINKPESNIDKHSLTIELLKQIYNK